MSLNLSEKLNVVILFLLGLIPLLWWKSGYIIAKGDYFPFWFNSPRTFGNDIHLWSPQNMGNPSPTSSFMLHESLWLILASVEFSVGTIQILFQICFFAGSGLSMYYLSKTVYPKLKFSPIIAGIFYMFNFFVLQSRLNFGFAWTYTFLPLLMALLIRVIESTNQQNTKMTSNYIIYFSITSTVAFSAASANLANIVLIILVLALITFFYVLTQRNKFRLSLNLAKMVFLSMLLNMWWIIPILNYYLWSPATLNPEISVSAWSWTHVRASFLNLFRLNGAWSWRPEYSPYYMSYSTPLLTVLVFVPFLTAAVSMIFKSSKSRLNIYMMFIILVFIFLAKGMHEPLSQVNLLLYYYVPSMAMFREPASKFTMVLMPLLALLIGYAVDHIAHIRIVRVRSTRFTQTVIVAFFIITFMISAYPLAINPIETKTEQIPFSSYVKIPDYWYQATGWLDNQLGDFKILITPPDDYYQMPYNWGYYGTDQFLESLIEKPTISAYYAYYYKANPDITLAFQQLYGTITFNKTEEFKAFLDLLNIKYILQRNDVQYNLTGRNIMPPSEMQAFLTHQSYLRLAQRFGQLDIYEYREPKPYLYITSPAIFEQTAVKIENVTLLQRSWHFTSSAEVQEWENATKPDQWQIDYTITQDNAALRAELWNSTWGWKTISCPLLPAEYGATYQIQADIKGQNAHQVHIKIAEYNATKNILTATYLTNVNDGTFNWTHEAFSFKPISQTTKYLQIQVWHGHETDKPYPNIIWIDNVTANGNIIRLSTTGLDLIFRNFTQNQPATILDYSKVNPTKIVASINATEPFILAISEALDQSWKAYINGKQIENSPLYLGLKGFYISQTGLLEVTIEYEPQRWFFYGSLISVASVLFCFAYIIYSYTKKNGILERIKVS